MEAFSQGFVEGHAKFLDNFVNVVEVENVGRSQQHVVAGEAIHRATPRIAGQTCRQRSTLDSLVHGPLRLEGCLGLPIRHQFKAKQETAATNLSDVGVLRKGTFQSRSQDLAP